ncbi:MAG TPA: macro domain-containing protein, partial [Thermoanaerobaculia bacterium]|nr:macro domain-containing protein [Thermoanaerobaculia bacterium]
MVELTQGNLLQADVEALVNTVNCVGVMGKGIALQFKQAFPENFRAYETACRAGSVEPGRVLVVPLDRIDGPRFILNFPTKRHWRQPSRLEDIRTGLQSLVAEIRRLGIRSVAVPPLGCGNGGLQWREVRPLIEQAFAEAPDVLVRLYPPLGAPPPAEMPVGTTPPRWTRARAMLVRLVDLYCQEDHYL